MWLSKGGIRCEEENHIAGREKGWYSRIRKGCGVDCVCCRDCGSEKVGRSREYCGEVLSVSKYH